MNIMFENLPIGKKFRIANTYMQTFATYTKVDKEDRLTEIFPGISVPLPINARKTDGTFFYQLNFPVVPEENFDVLDKAIEDFHKIGE